MNQFVSEIFNTYRIRLLVSVIKKGHKLCQVTMKYENGDNKTGIDNNI
uniref:Uncharacterized protein n=1 Tax=Rhizophora mucronata TaxID=61149 RepID=A0A2P2Q881_RHIMU